MSFPERRRFLKHAGLGAASLVTLPSLGTAAPPPDVGSAFATERAAFLHALDDAPQAETWDTTWTSRLTGKHKAMFDVPEVNGGVGVLRAGIWGRQFAEVLKVAPADLSTVIVIRHNAIFLAMNQEYWTTYDVAKAESLKGDDGKPVRHNPVLAAPEVNVPPAYASMMLDRQIANGAVVVACGLAFRAVTRLIQQKDKLDAGAARTKANAMLVPGVIMQPSGIFANVLAQEAGCAFVSAS